MGKQVEFFLLESDNKLIKNILDEIFDEIVIVPSNKSEFLQFNSLLEKDLSEKHLYLSEKNKTENIVYKTHKYYDGRTTETLDRHISPIFEYCKSFINAKGVYCMGRFYTCTEDLEFSKKISKFYRKLKSNLIYNKKYKIYLSKNIDLETALFLIPNEAVKFNKEDLKK